MKKAETAISFTLPIRQIVAMLVVCGLVGLGIWGIKAEVQQIFNTNLLLNAFIAGVFAIGVLTCFWQVLILI